MTSLSILLSAVSLLTAYPSTNFTDVLNHASYEDKAIARSNDIDDWYDYHDYMAIQNSSRGSGNNESVPVSRQIVDIQDFLETNYSNYRWIRDTNNCALTSAVSNAIPIEMQTDDFPKTDIETAIKASNVENYTSYGGCGPIATIGILDYFARYLGYDEIISDLTDSDKRVALATEVLTNTHFSIWGNEENSLVWPWDNAKTFNHVIGIHNLSGIISADDKWELFNGDHSSYWDEIVENIDEGLPVTLFTGMACGDGEFSKHYTNIYGYETWVGISNNGGEKLTKKFIKARLNWARTDEYYCDADILNCGQVGIITYDVNYANAYNFYANDFSEEFVNNTGTGQYFFYSIDKPVALSNGRILQTKRLRTSYIENKYLVLSPNRANAGTAYLDLTFPNKVAKLSFSASMWSKAEGSLYEDFSVQYWDGGWKNQIHIDPYGLTTLRDYPEDFLVLFPKNTNRIRFYATHENPAGDRNKGRICLDNFKVEFN